MKKRLAVGVALGVAAMAATTMASPAVNASVTAAAGVVQASWQMNEAAGATVMTDSGPNGFHAPIDQDGIDTGFAYDGAISYNWPRRNPTEPPASPERVIAVPDHPALDPRSDTYTVEIRYRTKEKFGNITQKGQSRSVGGQWKIQNPQGRPSCLFKGSVDRGAVRSPVALNDNEWHVLTCVRTPTAVEMYVDGAFVGRKRGETGLIDNRKPITIGGKLECDNIEVTCDYFSGQVDYLMITRG